MSGAAADEGTPSPIDVLTEALWAEVETWPGASLIYHCCERATEQGLAMGQSIQTGHGHLFILDVPGGSTWVTFMDGERGWMAWRRLVGGSLPATLRSDCRELLSGRRRPAGWHVGACTQH